MRLHSGSCRHVAYRMTCEDYAALLRDAAGHCQLCGAPSAELLIDHDHNVGQWAVRGLVCRRCNLDLGSIDGGRRDPCERTQRFLDRAWHLGRSIPPARQIVRGEDARKGVGFDGMEFVGVAEICHGLGISRQRFGQLVHKPTFPLPYMRLGCGKVWLAEDIHEWMDKSGRR